MKNVLMTMAVATAATACALALTAAPRATDIVTAPVTPDGNVAGRALDLVLNLAASLGPAEPSCTAQSRPQQHGLRPPTRSRI